MKNFNKIRTENNDLQRLQEFKQPLTKLIETVIYGYSSIEQTTHEDMFEFFLCKIVKKSLKT